MASLKWQELEHYFEHPNNQASIETTDSSDVGGQAMLGPSLGARGDVAVARPTELGSDTNPQGDTGKHPSQLQDIIAIKNLQLPHGVIAPDVWGKAKEQPALVSVHLLLRYGFDSAAGQDALDGSTIHYGELAKRIRAKCQAKQTAGAVSGHVEDAVREMAGKTAGHFLVSRLTVEVKLDKASMFGDGVTLVQLQTYDEHGRTTRSQRVFHLDKCRVMALIGVNEYERRGRQPIEASVWLHLPCVDDGQGTLSSSSSSRQMVSLFNLDQSLAQIIQESSFETLETLANFTVSELRVRLLDAMLAGGRVHVRLEKPRAIPFADAPCVEVVREIPRRAAAHTDKRVGEEVQRQDQENQAEARRVRDDDG